MAGRCQLRVGRGNAVTNRVWWRLEVWITRQTVAVMTLSPLWLGAQRTRIPWNSTRHVTQKLYLVCFMYFFNAVIALEFSRDVDLQIRETVRSVHVPLSYSKARLSYNSCYSSLENVTRVFYMKMLTNK